MTLWVRGLQAEERHALEVWLDNVRLGVEHVGKNADDADVQVNARVPKLTRLGDHSLLVRFGGQQSASVTVTVIPAPSESKLGKFACTMHDEGTGVKHRMQNPYLPLFHEFCRRPDERPVEVCVLNCGCGNGIAVEHARAAGFETIGVDPWDCRLPMRPPTS